MQASDVVQISITASSSPLSLPGFGTPAILGAYSKSWVERLRYYKSIDEVGVDFAVTTPEYLTAQRIFGQQSTVPRIAILRGANKPTQGFKVTVAQVVASATYGFRIGANVAEFTADSSPTNDEIVAGLVAAINGLADDNLTAAALGSGGSRYVQLSGALGSWDAVEALNPTLLAIESTATDPGVAADLVACKTAGDWYGLLLPWTSKAIALAAAAWAEANDRLFLDQTCDTACASTAVSGATDVAAAVQSAAYNNTSVWYHPASDAFLGAAIMGYCFSLDPGTETWALKTVAGVPMRPIPSSFEANLDAKKANYYGSIFGRNVTGWGKVPGALGYIDQVRGTAALKIDLQARVFVALANAKKVPFTDAGAIVLRDQVKAGLDAFSGTENVPGLLAPNSAVVTFPKVATVSVQDKASRLMPNGFFSATYAGAIHGVKLSGTISV